MLNPCWSNSKRFLSVLVFFGNSFVSTKNAKIFKNCVTLFWQLSCGLVQSHVPVASPHRDFSWLIGRSLPQSRNILRIFFKILVFNVSRDSVWRLVREWKVQSWGDLEIFMAYLATPSQVELLVAKNTQINFSKFFSWVFWRLALATCSRLDSVAKIACFAQIGQFLNFFSFSLKLLWLFIVCLTWNTLKLTMSLSNKLPFLHHFNSKSSRKRYGFSLSLYILHVLSLVYLNLWVVDLI